MISQSKREGKLILRFFFITWSRTFADLKIFIYLFQVTFWTFYQ